MRARPRFRSGSPVRSLVLSMPVSPSSVLERERQEHLRENENVNRDDRFLQVEMFSAPPMTRNLSGLKVEYALALIYSSEAGQREAIIGFDAGQGTQDLGFRGELPVLFTVRPAVPVRLAVRDYDGQPTTGRFTFFDQAGHVFPPQVKRLVPDLFFQKQIYRHDGDTVLLPPKDGSQMFCITAEGPEYRWLKRAVTIPSNRRCTNRSPAGALGLSEGLWLLQWRPPHSCRRLRTLHLAD